MFVLEDRTAPGEPAPASVSSVVEYLMGTWGEIYGALVSEGGRPPHTHTRSPIPLLTKSLVGGDCGCDPG